MAKTIEIGRSVFAANDDVAAANRRALAAAGTLAINVMASPGAGKTTLILATAAALGADVRIGVIEGDIAGDLDARVVEERGLPVVQVNTGGGCHLRADMIAAALVELPLATLDLLFIENVGNLVCPAGVALGEGRKVVVSSTPEGHDKPLKYPAVFREADAVVISKWDVAPHVGFDLDTYVGYLRQLNSAVPVFRLSARTGEGMAAWTGWLEEQVRGNGGSTAGSRP
ncbi:MAG: hydrogenase nickel incorporation protein HypB [Anaerolineae bacterium]